MNEKRNVRSTVLLVLSVSIIITVLTAFALTCYFSRCQYRTLGNFCGELLEKHPECGQTVLEILKAQEDNGLSPDGGDALLAFGYEERDFLRLHGAVFGIAGVCFFLGMSLFLAAFLCLQRKTEIRIGRLTEYLQKINSGKPGLLFDASEDEFSRLQDEIYKTVTTLYQTRDEAITAKRNFADNLFNIAHQLKTPVTAVSLSVQMMKEEVSSDYPMQIERQLYRLTHLEEALLLLARIDAGTLTLKREDADVLTLLTLAADNLGELFAKKGVSVEIPQNDEITVKADLEWTMEALMNLLKNCMEHSPAGGAVHCSYEKNPLYVQIQIWDEGKGFEREELPQIFERFYRGKNGEDSGIGIGLALSKALIEMQNGGISGFNCPQGGACFEIRFYCH